MLLGLVDANNFYVSCERLFNPRLHGRAVVVLSSNDGNVVARSQEAKDLGIAMGEPIFTLRERQRTHDIVACSSNFSLYGDLSARVMRTVASLVPRLEVYSIDESFIDLTGVPDPEALCAQIRQRVGQWVGIPVSIGLAETKTLAKCANQVAKKQPARKGVYRIPLGAERDELLARLPVTEIWGIAERSAERLKPLGILSAGDLRAADPSAVQRQLGIVGRRIVDELRGLSCLPLELVPKPRKSLCVSRTFGRPTFDRHALGQALAAFTQRAAEKLRMHQVAAGRVQFFAHNSRFRPDEPPIYHTAQATLMRPTNDTRELLALAMRGLATLFVPGTRYTSAGVLCLELEPSGSRQTTLFDAGEDLDRRARLLTAVDGINHRWRGAVTFASAGISRPWKPRSENRSPRWTTNWDEIPTVVA